MKNKKSNIFKKWLRGSSTIEASMLLPIILTLLFLLIYLSVFLYMRAGSVRIGYVAVLRASQMEHDTKKSIVSMAQQQFENLKDENYFGSGLCQGNVSMKGDDISIYIETTQSLPQGIFVEGEIFSNNFTDRSTFTAKINRPVSYIRNCRKIKHGIG